MTKSPSGDVLVIDDSPTSRTWSRVVLKRAGYNVREAKDSEAALGMIETQPPDLILLDVILPDLDGFQMTRRLRQDPALASIPIILLTTLDDIDSKVRGLEAGANDFLTKPPDKSELLARVKTLVRLRRSQAEVLAEKAKTELLYRVSRELSAELDLDTLLLRILDLTLEAIKASAGSIILLDRNETPIRQISRHQDRVIPIAQAVWDTVLKKGLTGWVIEHRQGDIIPDTHQDPRWLIVLEAHARVRTALSVPLIHAGQLLGVLTLTHEQVGIFTPDHLDLVSTIAAQSATVIEKAHAYLKEQLRARQLELADKVGRQATLILEPTPLIAEVSRLICQAFDYYYVHVALRQGDQVIYGNWGYSRAKDVSVPEKRLHIEEQSIVNWAARHAKPLLVTDISRDERYLFVPELPDTIAEMAVPLKIGGEIMGVLDIQSDRPGQLVEGELSLMETLASQIAIALKNARLFQESERHIRELTTLNQIGRALSSILELDGLLETVHQQVSQIFDTTNFYIATYKEDCDEWTATLNIENKQTRPLERYKAREGLTGYIIRNRQPVLLHSLHKVTHMLQSNNIEPVGQIAKSWLGVPLIAADKVLGVMAIQSYEQENLYNQQDLVIFSTIAAQAAIAIENARLYTETEQERAKMTAVLIGTVDAVVVTDQAGRMLLLNPAAERTFGVRLSNVLNQPLGQTIPNQALIELFQRGLKKTPPYTAEIPLEDEDEHTLYASIARVQGVGYVAVMQDITHLKELECMKNEFVSMVSHDLRSPLTAIRGYADLLLAMIDGEPKQFAQRIRVRTQQMAELLEDLLDLGKIEAGVELEREPCQLEDIVIQVVDGLKVQAGSKNVALTCSIPDNLASILGDPKKLRRATENLVGNAVKYTLDGGSVTVRMRQAADRLVFSVQDTGIGIPRESLPQLFGKFYRVKTPETDKIQGTGLGLAITKAIVEQHHGKVWVESEHGQGSTFGFNLPIDDNTSPA